MSMRTTATFAYKSWAPSLRFLGCELIKKRSIYGKYPCLTIIQSKRTVSSDIFHGLMSSLSTYYEDGLPIEGNKILVNENTISIDDINTASMGDAQEAGTNYEDEHIPIEGANINANENCINIDNTHVDALSKEDALEILAVMHGAPPLYQPSSACRCDNCNRAVLETFLNSETPMS